VKGRERGRVDVPVRALVKVSVKGKLVNGATIRTLIIRPVYPIPLYLTQCISTVRVHGGVLNAI